MSAAHLSNLYRVVVSPCDLRKPLRIAFVRAWGAAEAQMTVASILAVLEHRPVTEVEMCVYGALSAEELMTLGVSADPAVRLFEMGAHRPRFVEHPLFLLNKPARLTRKWAQILQGVKSSD